MFIALLSFQNNNNNLVNFTAKADATKKLAKAVESASYRTVEPYLDKLVSGEITQRDVAKALDVSQNLISIWARKVLGISIAQYRQLHPDIKVTKSHLTSKRIKIEKEVIFKFMQEGKTLEDLAKFYGVSVSSACRLIKKMGIEWKHSKIISKDELQVLLDKNISVKDIAIQYGCSGSYISKLIGSYGLERQKSYLKVLPYINKVLKNEVNQKEVADELNVSRTLAHSWFSKLLGQSKTNYIKVHVLELIDKGFTDKEIAKSLELDIVSVRYVRATYVKANRCKANAQIVQEKYLKRLEDSKSEILKMAFAKKNISEISKAVKIPQFYIKQLIKSPEFKISYHDAILQGSNNKKIQYIKSKMDEGQTLEQIAQETKLSIKTIKKYARMGGLIE